MFLDAVTKVRNAEIMYKAIGYYLNTHPMLFTRLMEVMDESVDHSRVVSQLRRTGDWALQLGQAYLKAVQKNNLSSVNEALNEVGYLEQNSWLVNALMFLTLFLLRSFFAAVRRRGRLRVPQPVCR